MWQICGMSARESWKFGSVGCKLEIVRSEGQASPSPSPHFKDDVQLSSQFWRIREMVWNRIWCAVRSESNENASVRLGELNWGVHI